MAKNENASVPAEAWKLAGFSSIIAVAMMYVSGMSVCMFVASLAIIASPIIRMVDERYGVAITILGLMASLYGNWMTVVLYIIVKMLSNACVNVRTLDSVEE